MDEEGEVSQGAQHEGGDEAGGDVVVGLPYEVDHQLEQGVSKVELGHLLGVPVPAGIHHGVVVDNELDHRLGALVDNVPGHNEHLKTNDEHNYQNKQ